MLQKKLKIILPVIAILAVVATGAFIIAGRFPQVKSANNQKAALESDVTYDSTITEDSKAIFKDFGALYSYVKKFGPRKTVEHLNLLSAEFGSCHDVAHRAGRYAYEIYDADSFKFCGAECHSGCYHGATEAYFHDHGTANLAENLNLLCSSELNGFFIHQCIHGIGHGLMAWTSYDLPEALKSCNMLSQRQDSCWSGVFMENIVGGLAKSDVEKGGDADHFTKYLSDDPHYPCNIVEDRYKSTCYFLQTSRMVQLFSGDFKKVADACSQAPNDLKYPCFDSMGRDVGGSNAHNPKGSIVACAYAPSGVLRTRCLMGAVQDAMWDPTGQDDALSFCRLLNEKEEKDACYGTIFGRAREVFTSVQDLKNFCSKAESQYQGQCPQTI